MLSVWDICTVRVGAFSFCSAKPSASNNMYTPHLRSRLELIVAFITTDGEVSISLITLLISVAAHVLVTT